MDSLKFFAVVSYKSHSLSSFPDVVVNGIYPDLNSAIKRQLSISGGQHKPSGAGNNSVYGHNGVISWIKQVSIGDLDNWNVRSPDKVIYQEEKSVTAKSAV